jgi:hypothetical protein
MKIQSQTVAKAELTTSVDHDSETMVEASLASPKAEAGLKALPPVALYAGIFCTSASVLLFEVALTRIFAVVLWAHLAFMVVSTALFGFGLSGVYLALRARFAEQRKQASLSFLCLLITMSIIGSYLVITNVPFRMWKFHVSGLNYLYLALWYVALVVPFFFAGLLIARLLSAYPARSARLYGFDLLGAAVGSLLLIPVISATGGEGTVVFSALLAALAGMCFLKRPQRLVAGALVVAALVLAAVLTDAATILPLKYHSNKRRYNSALRAGNIYDTKWSPISKVDIAFQQKSVYDIWIDGGTNESAIFQWSGKSDTLKPLTWSSIGLAPDLKRGSSPQVMIIGPAGGKEVLFALSHGAEHVDAVELDPSIVKFVNSSPYQEFMGNLYQNPKVTLVNDEGRSFLRRKPKGYYDIIQFVNNYTPVAMAAGALNLSETFLITKEAFHDYLDHLRPDGVLALHRGATLRVALTAIAALRERGVADPAKQIVITSGEVPFFEGFFLKNGQWTQEELDKISTYMHGRTLTAGRIFLWNPLEPIRDTLYSKILGGTAKEQEDAYTRLGINLYPATDDRPFIEHFLQIGKRKLAKGIPHEFRKRNDEKWRGMIPRGDFPYVAILFESALLALLFVGAPLLLGARGSFKLKGFWGYLGYFSALGFGFIVIEICLMKRYVLFLGNPTYAITTILVALLLGAGVGSIVSEKLGATNPRKAVSWVVPILALALLSETLLSPLVFDAFLGLEFAGRITVATLLLLPLGFLMGMPFPLGLKLISLSYPEDKSRTQLTAWVWGMNGYFTVIGSAATVFIALFAGFKAALLLGIVVYLLGLMSLRSATRGLN